VLEETSIKSNENMRNKKIDLNEELRKVSCDILDSVSVIAMRIPISTSDILSMAAASSSSSSLNALDGGIGDSSTENQLNSFTSEF
jgi:hypothetical protein